MDINFTRRGISKLAGKGDGSVKIGNEEREGGVIQSSKEPLNNRVGSKLRGRTY